MKRKILLTATLLACSAGTAQAQTTPTLGDALIPVHGPLPAGFGPAPTSVSPRSTAAVSAKQTVVASPFETAGPSPAHSDVEPSSADTAPIQRPAAPVQASTDSSPAEPGITVPKNSYPGGPGETFQTPTFDGGAAPSSTAAGDANPSDDALRRAIAGLLPPPDAVRRVREAGSAVASAAAEPIGAPPKAVLRSITVSLQPGEIPPTVSLSFGDVSTMTFADITGQPWYVRSVVVDDASYGITQVNEKDKTNIVSIWPKTQFSEGRNLVVQLEGLPMPVIVSLATGHRKTVDYRVDVQVAKRGPNAKADYVQDSVTPTDDANMQAFLDGVPPAGARAMTSSNNAVEAWRFNGMMYVRTAATVMSPAPLRKSSSDLSGVAVYSMVEAPCIIISRDGRMTSVLLRR